ncbi:MAG: hypothetical protein JWQ12_731 [Glaciihabitans sp.]|nr:hypothetical protein [Glaciihabitans sp.]
MSQERVLKYLLSRTVAQLDAAGAKDEALATFVPSRGIGPIRTPDALRPAGRAWRLGVLLLDRHGNLFSVGEVTRAVEPGRAATNRSAEGERRRAIRRIAARGRFAPGEVINFDYRLIEPGRDAVVSIDDDGRPVLHWDVGGREATQPLDEYLADRAELLILGPDASARD